MSLQCATYEDNEAQTVASLNRLAGSKQNLIGNQGCCLLKAGDNSTCMQMTPEQCLAQYSNFTIMPTQDVRSGSFIPNMNRFDRCPFGSHSFTNCPTLGCPGDTSGTFPVCTDTTCGPNSCWCQGSAMQIKYGKPFALRVVMNEPDNSLTGWIHLESSGGLSATDPGTIYDLVKLTKEKYGQLDIDQSALWVIDSISGKTGNVAFGDIVYLKNVGQNSPIKDKYIGYTNHSGGGDADLYKTYRTGAITGESVKTTPEYQFEIAPVYGYQKRGQFLMQGDQFALHITNVDGVANTMLTLVTDSDGGPWLNALGAPATVLMRKAGVTIFSAFSNSGDVEYVPALQKCDGNTLKCPDNYTCTNGLCVPDGRVIDKPTVAPPPGTASTDDEDSTLIRCGNWKNGNKYGDCDDPNMFCDDESGGTNFYCKLKPIQTAQSPAVAAPAPASSSSSSSTKFTPTVIAGIAGAVLFGLVILYIIIKKMLGSGRPPPYGPPPGYNPYPPMGREPSPYYY